MTDFSFFFSLFLLADPFFFFSYSDVEFQTYKGEIIEKSEDGGIVGRLWNPKKPDKQYEVDFKPWIPCIDELGVSKITIKNNNCVKITAFNSSNTCHISLYEDESMHDMLDIMEDVADHCLEGTFKSTYSYS